MAKKLFLLLVLAALVAGGAFAQLSMSGGGGLFFSTNFGGGIEERVAAAGGVPAYTIKMNMSFTGVGAYAFFDASYVEISAGFLYGFAGSLNASTSLTGTFATDPIKEKATMMGINFGFLGKYPFHVAPNVVVFPAAGIEYQMFLTTTIDGDKVSDPGESNSLWIRAGGGFDYYITKTMFIRGTALYGLRFANSWEKDMAKASSVDAKLGHSITIRAAIGFSF